MNSFRNTAIAMLATFCAVQSANAQETSDYPNRPVTIVVPFEAGGGTDNLMRLVVPHLSERLGEEFVIENRGGGGTAVGSVYAIGAGGDGYTLLMHGSSAAINLALHGELPYDLFEDLKPISLLASGPVVLLTHPSTGITSLEQLLEEAKAAPGTINFATAGNASSPHLALELLMSATDTEFVPVHYQGAGPATTDVLGGHVGVIFSGVSQSREHVDSGALIALAVTGDERNAALPDVPTMAELGYPEVSAAGTFWGLLAPSETPEAIIDLMSTELAEIMQIESLTDRIEQLGYVSIGSTPEEYLEHIRGEVDLWTNVKDERGIVVE